MTRGPIHVLCLILFGILKLSVQAQSEGEYIPDPGFEQSQHCPVSFNKSRLKTLIKWDQCSKGTPDHYARCSRAAGVPRNNFGEQEAQKGDAYSGTIVFAPTKQNYREYLCTELSTPLKSGQNYCVKMHVSLADGANFMTDGIGLHFSKKRLNREDEQRLNVKEHLGNPKGHVIRNDSTWTLLSGTYEAQGGERFLTVGNFRSDDSLHIDQRRFTEDQEDTWRYAYYYIDELSVKRAKDPEECSNTIDSIVYDMEHPPYEENKGQYKRVRLDAVRFEWDRSILNDTAKEQLRKVARLMKRNEDHYLKVNGHTDITGPDMYNKKLSKARAETVLDELASMGVDSRRLRIGYFGSQRPAASNETPEGRAQNRRVEFIILKKMYRDFDER